MIYPTFKIDKPIRLISLFSGYDSQALALKYLGVEFEHYKTCEWAVKSIQALKDLHFDDDTDYSKDLTVEQVKEYLFKKGISSNYNDPMTEQQINRLGENQVRTIYNNIKATHNLVNIQQVKGKDLEIKDTDKYCYIMTYSFPCQDLSLAGKGKGMSDTTTRSGMLWEVERILSELDKKPQVLLMENVPQVHGADNVQDFNRWQLRLEELGYKNYWKDLIATDYGIPQTRNRCFMVSILGDYNYTFPKPIPLKLKLKDLLEDNVPEKYYLSEKMTKYIFSEDDSYKVNPNNLELDREIACSKTTREGNTRADTSDYITETIGYIEKGTLKHQSNTIYSGEKISPCLNASDYKEPIKITVDNKTKIVGNYSPSGHETSRVIDPDYAAPTFKENHGTVNAIIEKNSGNKSLKETLKQNEIKDTCYIDTYNKRIDEEKSGTITTGVSFRNNTFLAIKNNTKKGYLEATEGDGINISGRMEYQRGNVQKDKAQSITCGGGIT